MSANFIPEYWARRLNIALRKQLVALSLTNQDYEGEIQQAGDTVHITRPVGVTVGSYTIGTAITVEAISSTQLDLAIDQFDYVAMEINDVYKVQANVELIGPYVEEASYALADAVDQYIFSLYTAAGSALTATTLSTSNIWSTLTSVKRIMSQNNAPSTGRWGVLSPAEIEILEQSTAFQRASDLGDTVSRNGFAGRAAGFDIFESNNLTDSGSRRELLFGHRIAITFANQFANMEMARRELHFSDLVKGLSLYGAKVIKTASLVNVPSTY